MDLRPGGVLGCHDCAHSPSLDHISPDTHGEGEWITGQEGVRVPQLCAHNPSLDHISPNVCTQARCELLCQKEVCAAACTTCTSGVISTNIFNYVPLICRPFKMGCGHGNGCLWFCDTLTFIALEMGGFTNLGGIVMGVCPLLNLFCSLSVLYLTFLWCSVLLLSF